MRIEFADALGGVVLFEAFAQPVRLHAHDVVRSAVEIRPPVKHFDAQDRLLDLLAAAGDRLQRDKAQEVLESGGLPEMP